MRLPVFFLLILTSCAGSPGTPPEKPLRDFRGIIHCHSKYSHDSQGTYEEILAAAKAAKVDFICITDHPPKDDAGRSLREGWRGLRDGVLFIQGHELAGKNLLAIGIHEPVGGDSPRERIAAVHRQGGLAFVSHPEEVTDWSLYETADGMEIYNVHATLKRKSKDRTFPLQVAKKLKEDPERSFQLLQELDDAVLKKWDELNLRRRFTGVAGNDAHQNVSFFGFQLDPYPRAFKFVSTHVLAEELTQEAVLRALKKGNAYVAFDISRPVQLGSGDRPQDVSGVVTRYYGATEMGEFDGTGGRATRLPQRQEWWLPTEKGRIPWVLFPYTEAPLVPHWP